MPAAFGCDWFRADAPKYVCWLSYSEFRVLQEHTGETASGCGTPVSVIFLGWMFFIIVAVCSKMYIVFLFS